MLRSLLQSLHSTNTTVCIVSVSVDNVPEAASALAWISKHQSWVNGEESGPPSWGWENRQSGILLVDFRLDTISSGNVVRLHGVVVGMQAHLASV